MTARRQTGAYAPVTLWGFASLAWLLAYLIPAARRMMLDMGASTLLNLVVTGLLWHASRHSSEAKVFWRLLALGWALNLVGNIAWGVYDMATGSSLPPLSWLDLLYLARYVLVMAALWRCVGRPDRRWVMWVAFVIAAAAVTWLALFRPALTTVTHLPDFVGVAVYIVLDFGLLYLAALAWARAEQGWRLVIGLIALAVVFYSLANLINFSIRLGLPERTAFLTGLLWPLSDVLTGLAAVYALWREPRGLAVGSLRELTGVLYLSAAVTAGLAVGDLIARRGQIDPVLVICAAIVLGLTVYWFLGRPREEKAL